MLYISRQVSASRYCVMDTDDGKEEIITANDLRKAIRMGVVIEGVETSIRMIRGEPHIHIDSVDVVQDKASMSILQLKTLAMRGVDIKVAGDVISKVNWKDELMKPGTTIRLSDYGHKCAACIFKSDWLSQKTMLTVVLDDSVKVVKDTFKDACHAPVKLDLREVSDGRAVMWAYNEWITNSGKYNIDEYIIDRPERLNYWAAVSTVERGTNACRFLFAEDTIERVAMRYKEEFTTLANATYKFASTTLSRRSLRDYKKLLRKSLGSWRACKPDFDDVRDTDMFDIFLYAADISTVNGNAVRHFSGFMHWFAPIPDDIKALYVKFCNRFNNWVLDLQLN